MRIRKAARKEDLMRTEKALLVDEKSSRPFISAAVAVLVSVTLSAGFTMMLGTTFGIPFKFSTLLAASVITALAFTAVFFFNKKWVSFGVLCAAPILFTVCFWLDRFNVRKGLMALLYYIKLYVFLWLPGDYPEDPNAQNTILAFLVAYNLVAVSITSFVIMKRRWIPSALVFYLPMFVFSVTNTDVHPQAAPCLVAGSGIIMILLCNAFRKKKQSTYERMLIILIVPVFAFMFLIGGIFPQNKYNKDKLAQKILIETRDWLDKTAGRDNPLRSLIERALNGFENSDFDESFDAISPLYSTPTNLSKVGPFNPSTTEILKVFRSSNPAYEGTNVVYAGNVLYLKVESLDTYQNNTLSSSKIKMNVYKKGDKPAGETAQYGITITPLRSSSVDIVPYYTDFYYMNNPVMNELNPYNSTHKKISSFASANVPVKTGNIYSDAYLNKYVYKTCLEVPYSTDRALILSGDLPDWYMDVYYGRISMSDADKVRRVTEYVRGLHPYNVNTEYPPKGSDFVPWFVSSGKSGICVHYAVTSVVLLRMIGIPARYVRGYVDPDSGIDKESIVYASHAHAWFEVFVPEYGWVMGDATPGYNIDEAHFNIDEVSRNHPEIETAEFTPKEDTEATTTSETDTETSEETETTTETTEEETLPESSYESSPAQTSDPLNMGPSQPQNDPAKKETQFPVYLKNALRLFLTVIIAAAAIAILILIGRAVFMIYWTNKFSTGKVNDRAIAYYHYYMLMARIFRFMYPDSVTGIAEKATFSGKDLTVKEYDELRKTCSKIMNAASADFPRHKLFFFRLLKINT